MRTLTALLLAAALAFFMAACGSGAESPDSSAASGDSLTSEAIIDAAVEAHGGPVIDTSIVAFTFRGDRYQLLHDSGRFRYERMATDSLGRRVREVLSNDSLYRSIDGTRVELTDAERASVNTTVNSVSYFALLPHALTDPAVQSRRLGIDTVRGTPYHTVEVTFRQEGGGPDWEDRFVYWFDMDTYAMDFLAYAYGLGDSDDDPGHRFRETYNVRDIGGVRVADYVNYTDSTLTASTLEDYVDHLDASTLEEVSRIQLDSVEVRPLS